MSKIAKTRYLTTTLGALISLVTSLVATVPSATAEAGSSPNSASITDPGAIDESNPLLPEVREKIKQAGGGGILATWESDFIPLELASAPSSQKFLAANPPSDCKIRGVVYFTQRWSSQSSVYNDGNTYCPGAGNISMNLGILKQDTVWGTVSQVASRNFRGVGPEVRGEAEYRCPTGNVSGFSAIADGRLTLYGNVYVVAQKSRGFNRYNCG